MHELLKCSYRHIRCPANNCKVTARPELMIVHASNCPLQVVWCSVCAERISVIATGHSCEKMLQRNKLLGRVRTVESNYLSYVDGLYSGDIVLPQLNSHVRHDQQALEQIFNVIRINRGLEVMKHPQPPPLPTLSLSLPQIPDFLIDESTQDVGDHEH